MIEFLKPSCTTTLHATLTMPVAESFLKINTRHTHVVCTAIQLCMERVAQKSNKYIYQTVHIKC